MITVHWVEKEPNQTDWEYEFYALSTDEKPSDPKIAVNSLLCELDTGDFYYLKSKGGSSTTRETLIEETHVNEWDEAYQGLDYDELYYTIYSNLTDIKVLLPETVNVVWDGVLYANLQVTTSQEPTDTLQNFGAPYDVENQRYDFDICPFNCVNYANKSLFIASKTNGEHTIEVYTESTVVTQPVWEKVGGGSSASSLQPVNPS